MGKRHFKGGNSSHDRKRRKEAAEKWKSTRGDDPNNQRGNSWNLEIKSSPRFEAFYKAQHFLKDNDDGADFKAFIQTLMEPLPACFRINPDYMFANELREQLMSFIGKDMVVDGNKHIKAVEQMAWYPNGAGYKLGTDKRSIRKLPELNALHKWMVQHTENGNITRQEAVSMVPPVALDVQPHHKCLDMCAAPGSKTSQLLEVVNRSLDANNQLGQGLVVANDADTDRAYMLVHQCRRINSPLLTISTHKGQSFPTIVEANGGKTEFFDRVLCDVPCSGDGTLRKNPSIWAKWSTSMGTSLHPLQLLIAQRGLQLLKDNGLMVYSTCSLSPYENESVVAELLRSNKGRLELVDARQFLPLFNARPGLSTWNVLDDYFIVKKEIQAKREARQQRYKDRKNQKQNNASNSTEAEEEPAETEDAADANDDEDAKEEENNEEEAQEEQKEETPAEATVDPFTQNFDLSTITDPELRACMEMGMWYYPNPSYIPEYLAHKMKTSLFPPTAEEAEWMHLERCLRCVPQDEDTGGFFVATLRKLPRSTDSTSNETTEPVTNTATNEEEEAIASAIAEEAEGGDGKKSKPQHGQQQGQKGLVEYHPWDQESFDRVKAFYDFDDTLKAENFFIREELLPSSAKANAHHSDKGSAKTIYYLPPTVCGLMQGDRSAQLKIVSAGIKVFEKKNLPNGQADYRLLQEGMNFMSKHIRARKVEVNIQDFCNILGGGLVSYATLSAGTIAKLSKVTSGVIICSYLYSPEDYIAPEVNTTSATDTAKSEDNVDASGMSKESQELVNSLNRQDRKVANPQYEFHAVCWKGTSRTLNVMCGKVDIEFLKHQLAVLNVFRPKISAPKINFTPGEEGVTTATKQEADTDSMEIEPSESKVEEDNN